jgi:predicted nucleic acid-binding protein
VADVTAWRKYVVDTNLLIDSFHVSEVDRAYQRFKAAFLPFVHLHAVVLHELRTGMTSAADRQELEHRVLEHFERARRIVTPSARCWDRAGNVLAEMSRADGLELSRVSKSFLCDVLIALSCREAGVTLVTANTRDFERIARRAPFNYVGPWPSSTPEATVAGQADASGEAQSAGPASSAGSTA